MFTSRLPVSTSVRRPNNPSETRPSNIPVTVRKANLFTPQTKRPFQSGTSTAGKSFTSGTATEKKFQRSLKPAPDRDAQHKMFDSLTDFLSSNAPGFPLPEAKKFFSSVSTTESSRIFELLIGRLLPDFKINRLEIDVPEALSHLDYPFIRSVTKSSLVSVTTRQAAAGLLHIFDWLIRFIQSLDGDKKDELGEDDDPSSEREIAVLKHTVLYPDTVYDENKKFLVQMHRPEDAYQLDQAVANSHAEKERLLKQIHEINEHKGEQAVLEEDLKKCRDYTASMQMYLRVKLNELEDAKQRYRVLELQKEEDSKQMEELRQLVDNHELEIDDVNRERKRLSDLTQTIQNFRDQHVQNEAEIRQLENKCQRLLQRSQEWCSAILNQLSDLADLLSSRPFLESISCELPKNLDTEENIRLLIQRSKVIDTDLEPILSSIATDETDELEQLKATDARYPEEILPRLQDDYERLKQKYDNTRKDFERNRSRKECQMNDLERRASLKEQGLLKMRNIELDKRNLNVDFLEGARVNYSRVLEASKNHLKSVLDRNRQRALIMAKEAKQEAEDWRAAETAWEINKILVNKAYKLLKKPLDLP